MTAQQLQELFLSQPSYRELLRQLENRGTTVGLDSLVGPSYSLVAAGAVRERGGVHVFVMEDRDAAGYLYNDLSPFLDEERLLFFPTAYKRSIQFGQEDPSGIVQRTAALNAVKNFTDGYLAICTYPEALVEKVVGMQRLRESILTIRVGDTLSTSTIEEILADNGFERVEFVYEPGQYSVRGGIVDIFSFSDNKPYRIDLFGDEVDSIRHFDLSSQLSVDRLQQIEVVPNLKDAVSGRERVSFPAFAAGATYWLDDGEYTLKRFQDIRTKLLGELDDPAQIDTLVTGRKGFLADTAGATMVLLKDNCQERAADATISFHTSPQPQFNKKFELLADDIRDNREKGYTTCLLTENKAQIERLRNIFNSMGERDVPFEAVGVTLHAGFIDHASRYCFYTDHQLFDRYHRYQIRGGIDRSESLTIQELNELKVGDYVVHIDHGVGRFGGLTRTVENGKVHEAIKLVYRDNDVLLVNVHALHRISKYKDKDSEPPKIYKLGSGAWQRMKQNTKKAVKDIARELIALYARRKASDGFAFSPDSFLQYELEASFIYEDTPDQQAATQAVKADMEARTPMDRLVCGDVGFGKTEVAIRAAFKAVTDSKQVAVLVPTTILALQHYRTFSERLKEFPVRIEHLSRAKSTAEVNQILKDVADGRIDILIGTHKILGKNVGFKDARIADYRRRAKVRGGGQGEAAPIEGRRGHADDDRYADSAYAAVFADGFARPVGHLDPAAQPTAGLNREPSVRRGADSRGGRLRTPARRAGLFRAQQGRDDRQRPPHGRATLPEGARGGGTRADAGPATRKADDGLYLRRVRRAGGHDDRRVGRRRAQCQYDHHQQRAELRTERSAPTPGPCGAVEPQGFLLLAHAPRGDAFERRTAEAAGHRGVFRPGGRLQYCDAGPRYPRGGQSVGR